MALSFSLIMSDADDDVAADDDERIMRSEAERSDGGDSP